MGIGIDIFRGIEISVPYFIGCIGNGWGKGKQNLRLVVIGINALGGLQ